MSDVVAEFGRGLKVPVAKTLSVDDDYVVLLDWRETVQPHMLRNLFRLKADGTMAWTISQPEAMGPIVNVDWQCDKLVAWAWGCYMLVIDERTGEVLESVFTK